MLNSCGRKRCFYDWYSASAILHLQGLCCVRWLTCCACTARFDGKSIDPDRSTCLYWATSLRCLDAVVRARFPCRLWTNIRWNNKIDVAIMFRHAVGPLAALDWSCPWDDTVHAWNVGTLKNLLQRGRRKTASRKAFGDHDP